ncbi:hypothetical protein HELRODRAFT_169473 [Helobdella robusta]|uniref:Uncharacterized protein n=1 Tax=Helobdella robusta TaxID=6412 RepID=T1F1Z5_HELRO|nr:hypothetical protein HELRODRAFT_169473 [Helobdella robusta]ESO08597.1 hypothetical protein HELRODRAFT_169473 [Helobdella robusta]
MMTSDLYQHFSTGQHDDNYDDDDDDREIDDNNDENGSDSDGENDKSKNAHNKLSDVSDDVIYGGNDNIILKNYSYDADDFIIHDDDDDDDEDAIARINYYDGHSMDNNDQDYDNKDGDDKSLSLIKGKDIKRSSIIININYNNDNNDNYNNNYNNNSYNNNNINNYYISNNNADNNNNNNNHNNYFNDNKSKNDDDKFFDFNFHDNDNNNNSSTTTTTNNNNNNNNNNPHSRHLDHHHLNIRHQLQNDVYENVEDDDDNRKSINFYGKTIKDGECGGNDCGNRSNSKNISNVINKKMFKISNNNNINKNNDKININRNNNSIKNMNDGDIIAVENTPLRLTCSCLKAYPTPHLSIYLDRQLLTNDLNKAHNKFRITDVNYNYINDNNKVNKGTKSNNDDNNIDIKNNDMIYNLNDVNNMNNKYKKSKHHSNNNNNNNQKYNLEKNILKSRSGMHGTSYDDGQYDGSSQTDTSGKPIHNENHIDAYTNNYNNINNSNDINTSDDINRTERSSITLFVGGEPGMRTVHVNSLTTTPYIILDRKSDGRNVTCVVTVAGIISNLTTRRLTVLCSYHPLRPLIDVLLIFHYFHV